MACLDGRTMANKAHKTRIHAPYWQALRSRMKALGMSFAALSERSGVSAAALKKLLTGEQENPTYNTLLAVSVALGVSMTLGKEITIKNECSVTEFQKRAARIKAEKIAKLVQGTSALESQAVSEQARRDMVTRTYCELMAGSPRKLWAA